MGSVGGSGSVVVVVSAEVVSVVGIVVVVVVVVVLVDDVVVVVVVPARELSIPWPQAVTMMATMIESSRSLRMVVGGSSKLEREPVR